MNESKEPEKEPAAGKPAADYRIPSRLREKLGGTGSPGESDEWEPPKRSPIGAIVAVIVVVAAAAGGWWWWSNEQARKRDEAQRIAAEEARAAFVADSIVTARAFADSVARADSIAAFEALPRWRQRQIIAERERAARAAAGGGATSTGGASASGGGGTAPAQTQAEPEEAGPFALDAGQFLFEDAANRAATTLGESTGLETVVRAVGSGDNATYHVYLGNYSSRSAATAAANDLLGKGAVAQARVVRAPR